MTGAELLVKALEKNKVRHIFSYPGAANCPLIDCLSHSGIQSVLTRSEQAAAHMASGYAKVTGKAGVCTATSGPGATNIITGIATAYMDSVPMVIITGQVASDLVGKDAFQEVDITGATIPFTKHNYLITNADEIEEAINDAFYLANTGRPGPVLIDVPIDIQKGVVKKVKKSDGQSIRGYKFSENPNELQVKRVADSVRDSKNPVILVGGGAVLSGASKQIRELVSKTGIPVVSTMNGLGIVPTDNEKYFGMVGVHGKKVANIAVDSADIVIALGARLGNRSFGNFALPGNTQKLVHVDIDPAEIGKSVLPFVPVVGDVRIFAELLIKQLSDYKCDSKWIEQLKKYKEEADESIGRDGYVNPKYFMQVLSEAAGNTILTTEVGQNQIWAVNNYNFYEPGRLALSAGMGTMGYGFPAAVGARAASGEKVIAILGDGSFQMNFAELATMKQWDFPVKMVLFNNNSLGMVREIQKNEYKGNYSCVSLDGSPDFCALVGAYGIKSRRISDNSEVADAVKALLDGDEPFFLEVSVSPGETTV